MYDFAYHRPKSLADAVSLLKGKPEGRVMSGGMTLIPTLKQRLAKPSDVVKEGQAVKVKLLGFDDRGKVRLSMKQVDQTTGEDLSKKSKAEAPAETPAE